MNGKEKQIIKLQRSVVWIGGNIAVAVMLVGLIVRFVGTVIIGMFSITNTAVEIILNIPFIFLGVFLGVKFAVGYVKRRALVKEEKIKIISGIAAIVPLIFVVLFVFLDILIAKGEGIIINLADLIINLISVFSVSVLIYFLVRHYLERVKD
jgi:hypothetical protein